MQTLPVPHGSTLTATKDPYLSPTTSPVPPTLPEMEENFTDFSGKTWPRFKKGKLSESNSGSQGAESPDANSSNPSNDSPKSEGTPTHYEHIGSMEGREGVEIAQVNCTTKLSPSHKGNHAGSDVVKRRRPELSSKSSPDVATSIDPQYCLKFTPGSSSPVLESISDHTLNQMTSSTELLMSSSFSAKSKRAPKTSENLSNSNHLSQPGTSNAANVDLTTVEHRQVGAVNGSGEDQTDMGGGRVSSYIAKMKAMGHRRASSVPLKKLSHSGSFSMQDEDSNVFVSAGSAAAAANRNRQLVSLHLFSDMVSFRYAMERMGEY